MLPHHWHLDPQGIPVSTVLRSQRVHDDEVRRHRAQLTPEQRRLLEYGADSPNWEAWFALEHKEQRHSGVDGERWKAHLLRQEQADGEEQMRYEAMLQRDS
ncbi:hypothetical protein D1007_46518 [Hordeum vulgare]|nr:hypothetical protein D1007_46518 [Hordeum vulgare]